MLFVFTSTYLEREKKLSVLFQVAHVIQHFFFCKQANIQLWQESAWWLFLFILQRSLQRSRSRKKELCKQQVSSETKKGAESGLDAGSCWNSHLQWARTPKGAGFLFVLPDLLYPKTGIKIRQLLPLPASTRITLRVPLNLMAGSSTPVCSALPHTKQLGAPSQWMQDSHAETERTTRFMTFISFYKPGSRQ